MSAEPDRGFFPERLTWPWKCFRPRIGRAKSRPRFSDSAPKRLPRRLGRRSAYPHRHHLPQPREIVVLVESDTLRGGDILPAFSLPVAEIFGR